MPSGIQDILNSDIAQWAKDHLEGERDHVRVAEFFSLRGYPTTETSVRRYRKKIGWKAPDVETKADPEPPSVYTEDHISAEQDLEAENAELRATNRRLFNAASKARHRSDEIVGAVFQAAKDAANNTPKVKFEHRPVVASKKRRDPQVALWHTTDWQMSKTTDTYDSDVCRDRVGRYIDMCQQLTDVQRADHPVDHGVVLMTGDMLEGANIFPGQEYEIDAALFEQIFQTAELEEAVVRAALETYKTVDVICEWGNHGRIGKKSDGFKPSDNIDRIIYQIVKDRMQGVKGIGKFQVSSDWYQHFTIGNYSAIAIHGDEIKGFGGNLPSYGILRKANAWASGVVEPFKDMYMGHYHQNMVLSMANGGSVYMSGSVESDNEFAREFVAATNRPSQRINFIHPGLGIVTSDSRIWLD